MAGKTFSHLLMVSSMVRKLDNRLDGKGCLALTSNLRVKAPVFRRQIGQRGLYTYPDVTVVCGKPQLEKGGPASETLINPTLLVEVLSPSTEANDFGQKFERYRTIESFREYVLVSQKMPHVNVFLRRDNGDWKIDQYEGLEATA